MEYYKSTCAKCGTSYAWQGYKTGIGKTTEQLAKMQKAQTVCRECGASGLQTRLDNESSGAVALNETMADAVNGTFGR